MSATGLCGSDLHYYNHFRNGAIQVREPLTLGHESAGTVTALGAAVSHLAVGDRVALEVGIPGCAQKDPAEPCEHCASGRYNICRTLRFRSSAKSVPHAQGTLQTRVNHPAAYCHRLPTALTLEQGALIEPLSVAMHARSRAGLRPGADALVLGAGAVGLLCAALLKAGGARRVVIADILAERVEFAVREGFADAAFTVPMARPQTVEDKLAYAQDVAEKIAAVPVGADGEPVGEVDVTFECTGVESCLHTAIYVSLVALEG